ncbi:MAG TPA: ATP-binding protein, partial [Burkholderiales bacterium]|nr:ATP-binding protein [Burkholderiales bacterium]
NVTLADGEQPGLAGGDYVRLDVTDNGEGIPPDLLPRVFEPFFTTKDVGKGSGLGLAQLYGFATQSGGTAAIASEEGRGTTLSLWLPRHHGPAGPVEPREADALAAPAAPCTVLFVEDDALVRSVVQPALEAGGFRVLVAATAQEANALLAAHPEVDVVFSDVVMPGGESGADLARRLALLRPGLPVLLATGHAALENPPAPVIAKPYRLEELKAALVSAARRR